MAARFPPTLRLEPALLRVSVWVTVTLFSIKETLAVPAAWAFALASAFAPAATPAARPPFEAAEPLASAPALAPALALPSPVDFKKSVVLVVVVVRWVFSPSSTRMPSRAFKAALPATARLEPSTVKVPWVFATRLPPTLKLDATLLRESVWVTVSVTRANEPPPLPDASAPAFAFAPAPAPAPASVLLPVGPWTKKAFVLVVVVVRDSFRPSRTLMPFWASITALPLTFKLEPCSVMAPPALTVMLPGCVPVPTLMVEPALVPLKLSVVTVCVPIMPPPTPCPLVVLCDRVVEVSCRASTLKLPPASTAMPPPALTLLPAMVVSRSLLMLSRPPVASDEPTLVVVVVVLVPSVRWLPLSVEVDELVVSVLTMVSNLTSLPALSVASPAAFTWPPDTRMSFLASRAKLPVADIVPALLTILPTTVVMLLILPSVDLSDTLPPVMVPAVLVMSPRDTTCNDFSPPMVPPVLVSDATSIFTLVPAITAPATTARRVAVAR